MIRPWCLGRRTTAPVPMARAMRAVYALVVFGSLTIGAPAEAADFCKLTSENALRSCQAGARSDFSLASGTCNNVSDASARTACQRQAQSDQSAARKTCVAQQDGRDAACKRLGGAPYDPVIDPANFVTTINHPLFPLKPGTTFVYEGQTAGRLEHNEFVVTSHTRVILGVTCVEVHDTAKRNGELIEDTLDWFCQDKPGNVWYFGENTKQLSGGLVVGLAGTWTAGVDGAKPGIIMKAKPAIGDFYRQEFSLGNAEDLAEVVSLNESVTVPYGSFTNCVKTKETSPLDPGAADNKYYCPGVGLVLTIDLVTGERSELISKTP